MTGLVLIKSLAADHGGIVLPMELAPWGPLPFKMLGRNESAISALRAAALRRLRSETRLWAQCGRWNSLQEGFYLQWNKTNFYSLHFVEA